MWSSGNLLHETIASKMSVQGCDIAPVSKTSIDESAGLIEALSSGPPGWQCEQPERQPSGSPVSQWLSTPGRSWQSACCAALQRLQPSQHTCRREHHIN